MISSDQGVKNMSDNVLVLAIAILSAICGFIVGSQSTGDSITNDCHNKNSFSYSDKNYKCEGVRR